MRAIVRRTELMELYKSLDRIHDPAIYDIDPNDSEWIEVDTFQCAKQSLAYLAGESPVVEEEPISLRSESCVNGGNEVDEA